LAVLTNVTDKLISLNQAKDKHGSNGKLCNMIQSKTSLVDVMYDDEVSVQFLSMKKMV
jgi:hypothetical protein